MASDFFINLQWSDYADHMAAYRYSVPAEY